MRSSDKEKSPLLDGIDPYGFFGWCLYLENVVVGQDCACLSLEPGMVYVIYWKKCRFRKLKKGGKQR